MQPQSLPQTVSYHLTIDSGAEIAFKTALNAALRAAKAIGNGSNVVVRFEDAKDESLVLRNFLRRINDDLLKGGDPRQVSASPVSLPNGTAYTLHVVAIDEWLDEGPEPRIGLTEALNVVLHVQWMAPLFYFFCSPVSGGGALGSPVPAGTREQAIQKLVSGGFPAAKAAQLLRAAERSQVSDTGPIRITRGDLWKLGITL